MKFEKIDAQDRFLIMIKDDGIGRQKSMQLNSAKKQESFGMRITKKRLDTFEAMHNKSAALEIIDLLDETGNAAGTEIHIEIPFILENHAA